MKVLNFSATQILPALLNRSKCQTIRPAWKKHDAFGVGDEYDMTGYCRNCNLSDKELNDTFCEKPARFKIGDKAILMWHQRGTPKDAKFCVICGNQATNIQPASEGMIETGLCIPHSANGIFEGKLWGEYKQRLPVFPKVLGTATITEVFQIEMQTDSEQGSVTDLTARAELGKHLIDVEKETRHHPSVLAERDGFKSAQEMFEWFNKKYGLEQPKKFWVYEFKWDSPLKKEK